MESAKRIIPKKDTSLEYLAELMTAHIEFQKKNRDFISGILNKTKTDEESRMYLYDVYGIKCLPNNIPENFLSALHALVKGRCDLYEQLEDYIPKIANAKRNMAEKPREMKKILCTLAILLNFISSTEQLNDIPGISAGSLARIAKTFTDLNFFKTVNRILEKHIPHEHNSKLERIIKFATKSKQSTKGVQKGNMLAALDNNTALTLDWGNYTNARDTEINKEVVKHLPAESVEQGRNLFKNDEIKARHDLDQYIKNSKKTCEEELRRIQDSGNLSEKPSSQARYQLEMSNSIKDLQEVKTKLEEVKEKARGCSNAPIEILKLIKENITTYFEIDRAYENYTAALHKNGRLNKYIAVRTLKHNEATKVYERLDKMLVNLNKLAQLDDIKAQTKECVKNIADQATQLSIVFNNWMDVLEEDVFTTEQTEKDLLRAYQTFKEGADLIEQQTLLIKEEISQYSKEVQALKQLAALKAEEEQAAKIKANLALQEQLKMERKKQDEEIKKRTAAYHTQVAEARKIAQMERDLKKKAQSEENTNNNNANESSVTSINIDFEEKILNFSKNHFLLLEDIVNVNKTAGVKYDDVINLIKNCGGEIIEFGSSHKRLHMNHLIKEIYFNEDEDFDLDKAGKPKEKDDKNNKKGKGSKSHKGKSSKKDKAESEVTTSTTNATLFAQEDTLATGGFYRHHGKAHTERKLSPFNLGLVSDFFAAAGIDKAMLATLTKKRNPTPAI